MRSYSNCPVCSDEATLVRHHDHFRDLCDRIAGEYWRLTGSKLFENWFSDPDWSITFPATPICVACNNYDSELKQAIEALPWFFSCSPNEIFQLKIEAQYRFNREGIRQELNDKCRAVLLNKVDQYQERLAILMARGVSEALIEKHWRAKPLSHNNTATKRNAMLAQLHKAPQKLRDLCKLPWKEPEIAKIIRALDWDDSSINSFIYWYHKQHGISTREEFGVRNWWELFGK
jgi:hypothetical protein